MRKLFAQAYQVRDETPMKHLRSPTPFGKGHQYHIRCARGERAQRATGANACGCVVCLRLAFYCQVCGCVESELLDFCPGKKLNEHAKHAIVTGKVVNRSKGAFYRARMYLE